MKNLSALAIILLPLLATAPAAMADPPRPVVQPVITQTNQPTIIRHIRLKVQTAPSTGY